MRFLELFAGAGGLSLGLERAGLRCVGHAEIAPHAAGMARVQPWPDVAPTLNMGAHTAAPGSNGKDAEAWAVVTLSYSDRPRRLMPLECERLMGWPDEHTARGINEQGRAYALKDTPRYALCGNGVGAPVAEWIGRRLMLATPQPPRGAEGEG